MSSAEDWQWAPDVDRRPVMVVGLDEASPGVDGLNTKLRDAGCGGRRKPIGSC